MMDEPKPPRWLACCRAPHAVLFWAAAFIWLLGAWACGSYASTLVSSAVAQGASVGAFAGACAAGGAAGLAAAALLFVPLARRNVARIEALAEPRLYECFRARFVLGLVCFDGGTTGLQMLFARDAAAQLAMGAVNICVCCALSVSLVALLLRWRTFAPGGAGGAGGARGTEGGDGEADAGGKDEALLIAQ
jgi:hypothetical protein